MRLKSVAPVALAACLAAFGAGSSRAEPPSILEVLEQTDLSQSRPSSWVADAPAAWAWRAHRHGASWVAGSSVAWSFLTQTLAARPNHLYDISVRLRADVPPGPGEEGNAFAWLDGLDARGRIIQTDYGICHATRAWTEFQRHIVAAEQVRSWRLRLAKRGGAGTVWFDRASVLEGPEAGGRAPRAVLYRLMRSAAACLVLSAIAAWMFSRMWRRVNLDGPVWAGLAMGVSAFLRLYRADLVEFKADQASTVWQAIKAVRTPLLPDHGLVSSYMTYQPPGQTWIFMPPALFSSDPLVFSLYEILLSLIAMGWAARSVAMLLGAGTGVRMLWILAATPVAVLYSRLVWAHGLMILLGGGFLVAALALVHRGQGKAAIPLCGIASLAGLTYFPGLLWVIPLAGVLWLGRRHLTARRLTWGVLLAGLLWIPYLRFEASRGYRDLRTLGHVTGEVSPGAWTRVEGAGKALVGNVGMDRWHRHTGLGPISQSQDRRESHAKAAMRVALYLGAVWMVVMWRRAEQSSAERRGYLVLILVTAALAVGPSLSGLDFSRRPELAVAGLVGQAAVAGLGIAALGRMHRGVRWMADAALASIIVVHAGAVLAGQRQMERHTGAVLPFEVPLAFKRTLAERLVADAAGAPLGVRYALFEDCGIWRWLPTYTPMDRYMRQGVEMDLLLYETLGARPPRSVGRPEAGGNTYEIFYAEGWGRYLRRAGEIASLEAVGSLGAVRWARSSRPDRERARS